MLTLLTTPTALERRTLVTFDLDAELPRLLAVAAAEGWRLVGVGTEATAKRRLYRCTLERVAERRAA
jgi:hypothetical protein